MNDPLEDVPEIPIDDLTYPVIKLTTGKLLPDGTFNKKRYHL
jgi:hypothetical protein